MKVLKLILAASMFAPIASFANDGTVSGKAKEAYEDTKDAAKKAGRNVKDEVCEMVNGKMECVAKKVGNKIKTGIDKVKDKAND